MQINDNPGCGLLPLGGGPTLRACAAVAYVASLTTDAHRHPPRPRHRKAWPLISRFVVWLLLPCACAFAQNFAIDWFTIDGGGGTSTGGLYSVRGTMGQPDAGRMSGGPYSLAGGLWVLPIAVQTINAPRLTIVPTATGKAILSWVPAAPGFVLQETWSLTSPNWSNSPSGTTNPVTVPATLRAKFYRLTKP